VDEEDFIRQFGNSDQALTYMHYCARAFLQESSRLYVVRIADNAKFGGVRVSTVDNFSECSNFVNGWEDPDEYVFDTYDILAVFGRNPGDWNNDLRVLLHPDTDDMSGEGFVLSVYEGTSQIPVEVFRGTLHDKIDGYGRQLAIETQVEEADYSRIQVRVNHDHPDRKYNDATPLINAVTVGELTQGSVGDPINQSHVIEGWNLFEDKEDVAVNILINGGYSDPSIQLRMIEIAEERDDCFAILDLPSDKQLTQEAVNYRRNVLNANTSYAALYGPDLLVRDTREARDLYVPPSGHIAGVYARTDRVAEAWFAPAGLNRGQLNVNGVREIYKQGHRDVFAENQINPVRFMSGQGIVVWGAETLESQASALSNINVRRLLLVLKNSISDTALSGVYEQNDEFLRTQLRGVAEGFLNPIMRGRGLYGFQVICDERNNTPDRIANGDVILDVYVDPVIPAKRIHLNAIIPKTGQIQFAQEEMGL
tara:strand:- start:41986 stop:43428 length:1443 start_codon:yes stop_codon:yes gene_type:complete